MTLLKQHTLLVAIMSYSSQNEMCIEEMEESHLAVHFIVKAHETASKT